MGGGFEPGVCGDGVQWYPEQCDDANTAGGDGCDSACQVEPGFTCDYGGACREVECGDSLQDVYAIGGGYFEYEQCDDGNAAPGDGCDDACTIETGFVCIGAGLPCREVVCGDGFQDGYFIPGDGGAGGSGGTGTGGSATAGAGMMGGASGSGGSWGSYYFEGCDDANVTSGDGCSATCTVEDGFICDIAGQPCREPRCGDGFIDFIADPSCGSGTGGAGGSAMGGMGGGGFCGSFEQCDDGNTSASDGCNASCTVEPGFACWEAGVPCHRIVCGDGMTDWPAEQCDDGNTIPDDGCTNCTYDGGFGGMGGSGGGFTGGTGFMGGMGGGFVGGDGFGG
jgi:cysteine-rich repeat protein